MSRSILAILIALSVVLGTSAQSPYDAPINWVAYSLSEHKLTVNFPKLPIRYGQQDACHEKRTESFTAYANEVVYTLTLVRRERSAIPALYCSSTSKFGPSTLEARRSELKSKGEKLPSGDPGELWLIRTGSSLSKLWIVDDLKQNRWIELAVTGRKPDLDATDFKDSLRQFEDPNAIDVGNGSPGTLGDRGVDTSQTPPVPATTEAPAEKQEGSEPLVIVSKVKAVYTDAARRNGERGTVSLRVTFLANGGIGDITVIKGLKYGLTEQAIAAARKMVFLPQKSKGAVVSTSRPVTFSFNIY
jgi:TonB family protein